MTWVVILLMVAFVGGSALQQILSHMGGGKQVVGRYGEESSFMGFNTTAKITAMDRQVARQDLQVLAQLRAKEFLQSQPSIIPKQPGFKGLLLSQLLFPDSQIQPMIAQMMKSAASQGQMQIDQDDIDSFFEEIHGMPDIYWILLKAEAKNAGICVPYEQAKAALKSFIPQLSQNQYDAAQVVNAIITQSNMTEGQIIGKFADLLSIMTYADMILSSENVTTDQLRSLAGRMNEKVSAEYVAFDATNFVDEMPEPSDAEIKAQFEKYKDYTANIFSDENPFGFGYQLPARVQLEYIAVLLSDIKGTIEKPTAQEMENYYQMNLQSFIEKKKVDPDNPESETVEKQQPYAAVEQKIQYTLTTRKTSNKTDLIMNDAVLQADSGLTSEQIDSMSVEQIKDKAASFEEAAKKLADKFGVKIYSGKTGYLSLEDIAADSYLGRLTVDGSGQQKLALGKALFAIEELGITKLGKFEGTAPKMWVNIGPMKDQFGRIAILARIVDAKKAGTAPNANYSYSTATLSIDDAQSDDEQEKVYSVKEFVADDVKLLKAYDVCKEKTSEFLAAAKEKGWDAAIEEYNNALPKGEGEDEDVAGQISIQSIKDRNVASDTDFANIKKMMDENPAMAGYLASNLVRLQLVNKFHKLYNADMDENTDLNASVELKSGLGNYAVKSISVAKATKQDYAKTKLQMAMMLDLGSSEALAVVHFNPKNIRTRMNFKEVQQDDDQDDQSQTTEDNDDSKE